MSHDPRWLWGVAPDHWPALLAGFGLLALLVFGWQRARSTPASGWPLACARRAGAPLSLQGAGVLMLLSGAIHLGLGPSDLVQAPLLGLLVLLDGGLLMAAGLLLPTGRRGRCALVLLLLATIVAYVALVASGREHGDQAGAATTLLELTALGLLLISPPAGRLPSRRRAALTATTLTVGGVVLGGTLWLAQLATRPALAAEPPTSAQRLAADRLVAETAAGIARFADPAVALAAGYTPTPIGRDGITHYTQAQYQRDRFVLDPTRPEILVYVATERGSVLVGAAYVMPQPRQRGPQPGGPLTSWHSHAVCLTPLPPFLTALISPYGQCPPLTLGAVMPAMLHVWIVSPPGGPFATDLDAGFVKALRGDLTP